MGWHEFVNIESNRRHAESNTDFQVVDEHHVRHDASEYMKFTVALVQVNQFLTDIFESITCLPLSVDCNPYTVR
jgi:hypothetical protein